MAAEHRDFFKERVRRNCKESFVKRVIPSHLTLYLTCLRQVDEEEVLAMEQNKGNMRGAQLLFNRIIGRPGWFADLLKGLRHPDVGLSDLAELFLQQADSVSARISIAGFKDKNGVACFDGNCGSSVTTRDDEGIDSVDGACTGSASEGAGFVNAESVDDLKQKIELRRELVRLQMAETLWKLASEDKAILKYALETTNEVGIKLQDVFKGSIMIQLEVVDLNSLDKLESMYRFGSLGKLLERNLLNSENLKTLKDVAKDEGVEIESIRLATTIQEEDIERCRFWHKKQKETVPLTNIVDGVIGFGRSSSAGNEARQKSLAAIKAQFPPIFEKMAEDPLLLLKLHTFLARVENKDGNEENAERLGKVFVQWVNGQLHACLSGLDRGMRETLVQIVIALYANIMVDNKDHVEVRRSELSLSCNARNYTILVMSSFCQREGASEMPRQILEIVFRFVEMARKGQFPMHVDQTYFSGLVKNGLLQESGQEVRYSFQSVVLRDFLISIIFRWPECLKGMGEPSLKMTRLPYLQVGLGLQNLSHDENFVIPHILGYNSLCEFILISYCLQGGNNSNHLVREMMENVLQETFQMFAPEAIEIFRLDTHGFKIMIEARHARLANEIKGKILRMIYGRKNLNISLSTREGTMKLEEEDWTPVFKAIQCLCCKLEGLPIVPVIETKEKDHETEQAKSAPAEGPYDETHLETDKVSQAILTTKEENQTSCKRVLEELHLTGQMVDSGVLDKISLLLRCFPTVQHLSLDRCSLTTASLSIAFSQHTFACVTHLCIADNPTLMLESESLGLRYLPNLTYLDVQRCHLKDSGFAVLVQEFQYLPKLLELNVADNGLTHEAAVELVAAFSDRKGILALRIHNNLLETPGAYIIAGMLKRQVLLEILNMSRCDIGDDGLVQIGKSLRSKNLRKLNLRENGVTAKGCKEFFGIIKSRPCMSHLDFSGNPIFPKYESGQEITPSSPQSSGNEFLNFLNSSSSWDHISLWKCNLMEGDNHLFSKPDEMSFFTDLTYLCLQENSLNDAFASLLAECLRNNCPLLRHLNLRDNAIGSEGAKALADAIEGKKYLSEIYFDRNTIGQPGAKAVTEKIVTLKNLQKLDLSFNNIARDFIEGMAATLRGKVHEWTGNRTFIIEREQGGTFCFKLS